MFCRPAFTVFVIVAPVALLVSSVSAQQVSSGAWRKPSSVAEVAQRSETPPDPASNPSPKRPVPAAEKSGAPKPIQASSTAVPVSQATSTSRALYNVFMPPQPFAASGGLVGDPYATGPAGPPPGPLGGPLMIAPPSAIGERFWIRGEYLHWWTEGMRTPPLVTTSPDGTPQNEAGILGEPNVTILFGGDEINDGSIGGFRTQGGVWLNPIGTFGIGVDYFQLFEQDDSFSAASDGTTILARPFFDTNNDRQNAQFVSFPGVVSGSIQVTSATDLHSFAIHSRTSLCPPLDPRQSLGGCGGFGSQNRVDWLLGYRYLSLEDDLQINDNQLSLDPNAPGTIVSRDRFRTENHFHGLDLGVMHRAEGERFWLESLIKVALGNNRQRVEISGSSDITEAGVLETFPGGTLAQRSNSGQYERSEFAVVPELGVTLGARIGPRLSVTVGYSLVYFSNVVRAGDQIDTDLNPNLFPPEATPFTGALRPQFAFRETDYWAHGLGFGGDFRF